MLATVFLVETSAGMAEEELRALIFFTLITQIVALIFVNRSFGTSLSAAVFRHNVALRWVLSAIVVVTLLILFVPWTQTLLKFGSIAWPDMALAVGLGAVLLFVLEACKPLVRQITTRLGAAEPPPTRKQP